MEHGASISPRAQVEIHQKVGDIVDSINLKQDGGEKLKVLDAAAGIGHMSCWLNMRGYDVVPVDIDTSQWRVKGLECRQQDLNGRLALESGFFDLVISIETIEHLENPFHFLRELIRVLKEGGTLIVSTPNVHSAQSRLKYLFLGLPSLFEYIEDDKLGQHIMPVNIGMFLQVFTKTNVKLTEVYSTGPKVTLAKNCVWKAINIVTAIRNMILESPHKRGSDYYLYQLSAGQYSRLLENVSLIVVGTKEQRHYDDIS